MQCIQWIKVRGSTGNLLSSLPYCGCESLRCSTTSCCIHRRRCRSPRWASARASRNRWWFESPRPGSTRRRPGSGGGRSRKRKLSRTRLVLSCRQFFNKWAIPGIFFICFRFFKQHYNNYNKYLWKNVHPVYSAESRTHDLRNMSLLP